MSKARRRTATAIYLTMMLSTVVTALMDGPSILILLFCFLQWCALVWYIASYIPYGQKIISKCLGKAANSAANSTTSAAYLYITTTAISSIKGTSGKH